MAVSWSRAFAEALRSQSIQDMAIVILNHPESHTLAQRTRERLGAIALGAPASGFDAQVVRTIAEIIFELEALT